MSEPQRATPLIPIVSAWRTEDCRPSKPQTVVGSPPQTSTAQRAVVVARVAVVHLLRRGAVGRRDEGRRVLAEVLHPAVLALRGRLVHEALVERPGAGRGEVELGDRLLGEARGPAAPDERGIGPRAAVAASRCSTPARVASSKTG